MVRPEDDAVNMPSATACDDDGADNDDDGGDDAPPSPPLELGTR